MEHCEAVVISTGKKCSYKPLPGSKVCGVHRAFVSDTCAICLDEVSTKAGSKRLKCGHIFHGKCVSEWFDAGHDNSHCCATCRKPWRGKPVVHLEPTAYLFDPPEGILQLLRGRVAVDNDFVDAMSETNPDILIVEGILPDGEHAHLRMTIDDWRFLVV